MRQDLMDLVEAAHMIQVGTTSLQALSASFPEVWQEVMRGIHETVNAQKLQTLGATRGHAVKTLQSLDHAIQTKNSPQLQKIIQAKMTILAIDQFADVLTGKVGLHPKLTDQALMKFVLLPRLQSGLPIPMRSFDKIWRWFKDPLWASGELQRQGFWSIPTAELLQRFKAHVADRSALEMGAGRGLYLAGLTHLGVPIQGVDDQSWQTESRVIARALPYFSKLDAKAALKQFKPAVVICSWPPPDNEFESSIFETPSVGLYLAIVSKHSFASGNWSVYQRQRSFHCTTSEPLNLMLRPLELEQQVLIFRRR